MSSSLAGRPPYATDEPESFYETPKHPQHRLRQPAPPNPNNRSSAYDVYDNYLGNDPSTNRQSGMGALGMGFMNGSMDDDEDDDDDDAVPAYKRAEAGPLPSKREEAGPLPSKHAALAAATGVNRQQTETPPPQYIAAPRPGYAAPIAALNLSKPEPTAVPGDRQQPNLRINPPSGNNAYPFSSQNHSGQPMYKSPSPISVPSTPHPLQPPMSPITPAFARPPKAGGADVKFAIPREKIMRGYSEEAMLPKRGDAGDDFWRRFSMVAKEEETKPEKQSAWLKKTQSGTTRLSVWVWIVGLVLLLVAGGAIGLGVYISHNSTTHNAPTAIGGSAQEAASSSVASSVRVVGSGTASGIHSSTPHVSPTNTVARRAEEPRITSVLDITNASHVHTHKRTNVSRMKH